ncbi:MAG: hypothetical protein ABIZ57_05800, partial [Candidatus Limnocylindria bacterium]
MVGPHGRGPEAVDGVAGCQVDEAEADDGDAEQDRHRLEQASCDVAGHAVPPMRGVMDRWRPRGGRHRRD